MIENIGFPNEFVDPDHLDEMYNHVSQYSRLLSFSIRFLQYADCPILFLISMYVFQININRSAGFFWNLIESNKFRRFQLNYELEAGFRYSIWVKSFHPMALLKTIYNRSSYLLNKIDLRLSDAN